MKIKKNLGGNVFYEKKTISCQSLGFLTLVLSHHHRLKSYNCDNKYSDLKRVFLCAVTPLLNSWVLLLADPSLTLL